MLALSNLVRQIKCHNVLLGTIKLARDRESIIWSKNKTYLLSRYNKVNTHMRIT